MLLSFDEGERVAETAPSPARLEAFSDGVIAVIITIMVLEIKIPHADGTEGLKEIAPSLLIYSLSFAFTGIYWLNHQHLVRRVQRAGHGMQCANLSFLFTLSLLPLSTADVIEKHTSGFAVAVYAASLLLVALSFMWLRLTVHSHLNRYNELAQEDRTGLHNHLLSLAVYAGSIVFAFVYPHATLLVIGGLTFMWALPNLYFKQARSP
jgi:uncharacterized membrane protein